MTRPAPRTFARRIHRLLMPMLLGGAAIVMQGAFPAEATALASPWQGMEEAPPVPYVAPQPQAMALSREWIQLLLPERAYQAPAVDDPNHYRIRIPGGAEVAPTAVMRRHFGEFAPHNPAPNISAGTEDIGKIQIVYHIFLRLPAASLLNETESYSVIVAPEVLSGGAQFDFAFDPAAPSESIHTNQIGYLPTAPKSARVSFWLGQGSIDFDAYPDFHLVDTASGNAVFSGALTLLARGTAEIWGKADVYAADFSAFAQEGTYRLYVPGVGSSYPFRIAKSIPYEFAFTAVRALMHQRDGDHGLDRRVRTHWRRPAAHLDDAIDETTGIRVDMAGGHMDAGDRGKYPMNMGLVGAYLLSGAKLYPDAVVSLGDNLGIAESGNGIPDYLDETDWELDALYRMVENSSLAGAMPKWLRPASQGYELFVPPEGQTGRKLFSVSAGPYRAQTLMAAGALAMAYNTPLFRQHFPEKSARYLAAARKAFATYLAHSGDGDPFFRADCCNYDVWDTGRKPWSDEVLFAAANLLEATGEAAYLAQVELEMPADVTTVMRWGHEPQGPWLPAFLSVAQVTHPSLDAAIKTRARDGVIWFADRMLTMQTPYGALIYGAKATIVGWFFTAEATGLPMMFAHGLTGEETYRRWSFSSWDYLLGTNPANRSYISGMGVPDRRPRWLVHEISQWYVVRHARGESPGWAEMTPGIPNSDIQNGEYESFFRDTWNAPRTDPNLAYYPTRTQMAPMSRSIDGWVVANEFVIPVVAAQAVSLLPMIEAARTAP